MRGKPNIAGSREIAELIELGAIDQLELARLKKRKLRLKDEIERMRDRSVPDIIA